MFRVGMHSKKKSGYALVVVLILILVSTVGLSMLLKRSSARVEISEAEATRRALVLSANAEVEKVKQKFIDNLQKEVANSLNDPPDQPNILLYNGGELLKPSPAIPATDSFHIAPLGQGPTGAFKPIVKVDSIFPKLFYVKYISRDPDTKAIVELIQRIQVEHSSLNDFAVAFHSQDQPLKFGGPSSFNGQVAAIFSPTALQNMMSQGISPIQIVLYAGEFRSQGVFHTNAPQSFLHSGSTLPSIQTLGNDYGAYFEKGVNFNAPSFGSGLATIRDNLKAGSGTIKNPNSGGSVVSSRLRVWTTSGNGDCHFKVEESPGGWSSSGTFSGGTDTTFYLRGNYTEIEGGESGQPASYCHNFNLITDGNIRIKESVIKQESNTALSNGVLWPGGSIELVGDTKTLVTGNPTLAELYAANTDINTAVVPATIQIDLSMIGAESASTIIVPTSYLQPNGSNYVNMGNLEVNGLVIIGHSSDLKFMAENGDVGGFQLRMTYPQSLASKPPASLTSALPLGSLVSTILSVSYTFTDPMEALNFVGASPPPDGSGGLN